MKNIITVLFLCFLFLSNSCFSQNDTKKWYFGANAGLDFTTSPPSILTGSMNTQEGCASVADVNGNLLFYTDGSSVWTQAHTIMANGTGLFGNTSTTQSSLIISQPGGGSNVYYLFTLGALGSGSLHVSTIDMSLASGQGSVTSKNTLIYGPSLEKLTAVKHCNGNDFWVTIHDVSANNFRSYMVTVLGVNPNPVVSAVGSANAGLVGYMKFSPNGKKIAYGSYNTSVEVFDFDASTGVVSNSLSLAVANAYGIEFSPDGSKLYASSPSTLYQWDLCAGNNTAVAASQYTMAATFNNALQLASNGKVYVARYQQQTLGVIANPNIAGSGCNYNDLGQSISPNVCNLGLPNFVCSALKTPLSPFTYTVANNFGCQGAGFSAPAGVPNYPVNNCAASGYSVNSLIWTFGDLASGSANSSTLTNPTHTFTNAGYYEVQLVLYYNCGIDTLRRQILVGPCVSVTSTSITCATPGSATVQPLVGSGPFSYTWMPTAQTGSVAISLGPGTYTIYVTDTGNNSSFSVTTVFVPLIPMTGTLNKTNSLNCNGVPTGTANYTNISGGSGMNTYSWTNGTVNYTNAFVSGLSAGSWSGTVTDVLTGCSINNSFIITQPPALTLNISSGSATACAGKNITFTATASGGTPTYSFSWPGSVPGNTFSANQNTAGIYTYSVSSLDANNCLVSTQITTSVLPNPSPVIISNSPLCGGSSMTISISGANTYTWSGPLVSNATFSNYYQSFVDQSMAGAYTATATGVNGCTASTTHTIVVLPTPTLSVLGSTVCTNQTLSLTANASNIVAYMWSGPSGFVSGLPNILINNPNVNLSGTYTVVATAANSCTGIATVQASVTAMPTPVLSLSGPSLCAQVYAGQTINIQLNASGASSYTYELPPIFYNPFPQGPSNILSLISQYNQAGPATLTLTGANGNCTASVTAVVNIVPNPTVTLSVAVTSLCAGDLFTITASGATSYTWISGMGAGSFSYINGAMAVISPFANTIYQVSGYNGSCFSNPAQTMVNVSQLPLVGILGNTLICSGQSNTLTASTNGNSFLWSNGITNSVVIVNPVATSVYSITVYNLSGCSNTAVITINVNTCTGLVDTQSENDILIYPTPAKDLLYIQNTSNEIAEIIDNLGRVLITVRLINGDTNTIDTRNFANGIYYIRLKGGPLNRSKIFVISG